MQLFPINLKGQNFSIKNMWKTSTSNSDFIKWTHHSSLACTHGGQDKKNVPQGTIFLSAAVAAETVY